MLWNILFFTSSCTLVLGLDVALINCCLLCLSRIDENDSVAMMRAAEEVLESQKKVSKYLVSFVLHLSWHHSSHLLLFGCTMYIKLFSVTMCKLLWFLFIPTLPSIIIFFQTICDSSCSKSLHLSYLESLLWKPVDSGVSLHFFIVKQSINFLHTLVFFCFCFFPFFFFFF